MALLFDHSEMSLSFSIHHKLTRILAKDRHLNAPGKHIFLFKPMPVLLWCTKWEVDWKSEKRCKTQSYWMGFIAQHFYYCLLSVSNASANDVNLVRRTHSAYLCNSSGRWQFSHWCSCHSLGVLTSELHKVTLTKSFRTWPCHLN